VSSFDFRGGVGKSTICVVTPAVMKRSSPHRQAGAQPGLKNVKLV
jgi:hypothetical protein